MLTTKLGFRGRVNNGYACVRCDCNLINVVERLANLAKVESICTAIPV